MARADLHKLGGIEAIVSLLGDNCSEEVRTGAAFALGVAAANNEPFVIELAERGGDGVMLQLIEVMAWPCLLLQGNHATQGLGMCVYSTLDCARSWKVC